MRALIAVALVVGMSAMAHADCTCRCVDGEMQPICDNAIDFRPICPPAICPIDVPSIAPLSPPILPPLGTSSCRQARVCDTRGNCQWQQVCR